MQRTSQEAGFATVERESLVVDARDVERAIEMAIEHTEETARMAYRQATTSPRKDALFAPVLLACALAPGDDLSFFAPSDIRKPLERISGKLYDFPQFVRHLKQFSSPARGEVLQITGAARKQRYRFTNPLLRPYVVLRGVHEGVIDEATVSEFSPDDNESLDDGQPRLL